MEDYLGYQGKICVVTGSSSGMGKATCERLIDLGAIVYGIDRNEFAMKGMKAFIQADLSS